MTFTELMGILNGEYKEIAGTTAKNQCVDLANTYIKYVLGLPIIEWTNAVDFPLKAGDNYDYILNTPTGIPKEGDLVIWGGEYGHIAIFIEGNANRFTSFDENYPTGSPCHIQEHSYYNVKGWLRPCNNPTIIAQSGTIQEMDGQTKIPLLDNMEIQTIRSILNDQRQAILNRDQEIIRLNKLLADKDVQIDWLQQQVKNSDSGSLKPSETAPEPKDEVGTGGQVLADLISSFIKWWNSKF